MAKTREFVCIHYQNEHNCDLGKDGTFYGHCQTCDTYSARKGSKPARVNTKREKLEKAKRKDYE